MAIVGACSTLLPLIAALVWRPRLHGARAWIFGWCVYMAVGEGVSFGMALSGINNHLLDYLTLPIAGALLLWGLSLWQTRPLPRLTLRAVIPFFLLTWVGLAILVEDRNNFSSAAEPMYNLLGLGTAVFTLMTRSSEEVGALTDRDWFWICGGLALYFGTASTLSPIAKYLMDHNQGLVNKAYEVKSAADVLAYLAIARGITCPTPHPLTPSGDSSLLVSSP